MKKLKFYVLSFLILLLLATTAQAQQGIKNATFTIAGPDSGINLINTSIAWHKLSWAVSGTASACTVALDSSPDGITWTAGGVITGQTCTANGSSAIVNLASNYVRINMTALTLTAGSSVTVTWSGWTSNPAGGGITFVTSNPATCVKGTTYYNSTSGQTLYCTATNTLSSANYLSGATAVSTNGLIGLYKFSSAAGDTLTTIQDFTGNGNNFTNCGGNSGVTLASPGLKFPSSNTTCYANSGTGLNAAVTISVLVQFQPALNYFKGGAATFIPLIVGNGNGSTGHYVSIGLTQSDALNDLPSQGFWISEYASCGAGGGSELNRGFAYMQGTALITLVMSGTNDQLYVNGQQLGLDLNGGTAAGCQTVGNFSLGATTGGSTFAEKSCQCTYLAGAFYNRALTQPEIANNAVAMNPYYFTQAMVPNMPGGVGGLCTNTDTHTCSAVNASFGSVGDYTDFAGLVGDSIMCNGVSSCNWFENLSLTQNDGGWVQANTAMPSATLAQCVESYVYCTGMLKRPYAGRNVIVAQGCSNDLNVQASGTISYQILVQMAKVIRSEGFTFGIATGLSRTTANFDTRKDICNNLVRQNWRDFADTFIDLASDALTGCDGCAANATNFPDGVHPSGGMLYNHVAPYTQIGINRYYGNRDFSTATTYSASATAAVATTAGSESTNTITVTMGATPANCQAGNMATVAGTTPAGYSGAWYIKTRSATQITYYSDTTGLGVITVQGTVACPQQQDADNFFILGGAGALTFTLQPCEGRVGQSDFAEITDTSAWTITPWNSGETINGGATFTTPVAVATNHPVVELKPILTSAAAGGCTWQASIK